MAQNKTKISITLDTDLLERYKKAAEAREETISSLINRQLANNIDELEEYLTLMESPLYRAVAECMIKSPKILKTVTKMLGDEMPDEEFDELLQLKRKLIEKGRQSEAENKGKNKPIKSKVEPA